MLVVFKHGEHRMFNKNTKLIQAISAKATEQTETKNTRHTKCNSKQHGTIYQYIQTVKWNEMENLMKLISEALNVNCLY